MGRERQAVAHAGVCTMMVGRAGMALGLLCSLLGVLPTRAGAQQVSAAGTDDGLGRPAAALRAVPATPVAVRLQPLTDSVMPDERRRHYLGQQLQRDPVVRRWVDRAADPIRVWIQGGEPVPGWETHFRTSVREALALWNAVGLPVRLLEVADSAAAEVHVVWAERLGDGESGRAVRWSTPAGRMRRGRVMLGTLDSHGVRQTAGSMRAVALHELGHVLGLGHATDARDIMAPWIAVSTLSEADRQSALLLYRLPAGPVDATGPAPRGVVLVDGAKLARGGMCHRRVVRRDVSFPPARRGSAGKAPA